MTTVYIALYRQRTLPNINEERSVQGQINQIILLLKIMIFCVFTPQRMGELSFKISKLFKYLRY